MGAPAQRILWMRFTQNNFFNTQTELIRETSIILNIYHLYMENYFAFGSHMKYGCAQAPPVRYRDQEWFYYKYPAYFCFCV